MKILELITGYRKLLLSYNNYRYQTLNFENTKREMIERRAKKGLRIVVKATAIFSTKIKSNLSYSELLPTFHHCCLYSIIVAYDSCKYVVTGVKDIPITARTNRFA